MPQSPSADSVPTLADFELALNRYLNAYLEDRDLSAIETLLDDSFLGFGTGPGEHAFDKQAAVAGYRQDIEDAPEPIDATIHACSVQPLTEGCATAALVLDMKTCIQGQCAKFNQLRLSIAFVARAEGIRMASMHISFPTQVHEEDEAFPLKELEDRARLLQRMVHDETKTLQEAYQDLEQQIITDPVSGLYSRIHFERVLENEHARFTQFGRGYALVLIDLDHFKSINDTYGHLVGDAVLKAVGGLINQRLRGVDRACRWGGDEFLVLLPQKSVAQAKTWAECLVYDLSQAPRDQFYDVGMSIGVGAIAPNEHHADLFSRVDQRMYHAKTDSFSQIVSA